MSEKKSKRQKGATVSPYDVGKGKPPKEHRIKPGEVRNPRGRPSKPKIGSRTLGHFLDEQVTIGSEHGPATFTKRELMYAQIANRAAKGEMRAIAVVLEHDRTKEAGESSDPLMFDPALTKELLEDMRRELANDVGGSATEGDTRGGGSAGATEGGFHDPG